MIQNYFVKNKFTAYKYFMVFVHLFLGQVLVSEYSLVLDTSPELSSPTPIPSRKRKSELLTENLDFKHFYLLFQKDI